jgi:hypothetical protein
VLAPVRFSDEFSARVAVRIWLDETVVTTRPLNVATPDEKLDDVVPVSATGLPDIDIELLAAVANVPLFVNCTFVVKRPKTYARWGSIHHEPIMKTPKVRLCIRVRLSAAPNSYLVCGE